MSAIKGLHGYIADVINMQLDFIEYTYDNLDLAVQI